MPGLKVTAGRLDVLRGVAAGEVKHHRNWGRDPDEDVWRPADGGRKKVNGAISWLKDAGLIKLGAATGPSMYAPKPWQLSTTGEQYLAGLDNNA